MKSSTKDTEGDFSESLRRLQDTLDCYLATKKRIHDEKYNEKIDKILIWAREVSKKTGIPLKDL